MNSIDFLGQRLKEKVMKGIIDKRVRRDVTLCIVIFDYISCLFLVILLVKWPGDNFECHTACVRDHITLKFVVKMGYWVK